MKKVKGVKLYPDELTMYVAGVDGLDHENIELRLTRPEGTTDHLALTVAGDPDAVDREEFASGVRSTLNISADALTIEPGFEGVRRSRRRRPMTGTDLAGKTAVVTGAGRGIGRNIALGLAEEGMNVVLAARTEEEITQVAEAARDRGSEAVAVPTDVTSSDDVAALFDRTREAFEQVDLLVNNAGTTVEKRLWKLTDDEWETVLDVNLSGTFRCSREALTGGMLEREDGTIINMGSLAGKVGFSPNERL